MIRQKLQENPDRILTRFGIFLGVVSVVYFGREAIFNLTPVTKSVLLVLASAFFLGGSKLVDDKGSVVALYLFSSVSYLTFLFYYILRMKPATGTVFILLSASGAIFTVIGKKIGEYEINTRKAKKVGAALLLASFLLVSADLNAPDTEYRTEFKDTVQIEEQTARIGNVTVQNNYFLPQVYRIENIETCSANAVEIRVEPEEPEEDSGIIGGKSEKTIGFKISRYPRTEITEGMQSSFRVVESDNCPDNPDNRTIYITERDR